MSSLLESDSESADEDGDEDGEALLAHSTATEWVRQISTSTLVSETCENAMIALRRAASPRMTHSARVLDAVLAGGLVPHLVRLLRSATALGRARPVQVALDLCVNLLATTGRVDVEQAFAAADGVAAVVGTLQFSAADDVLRESAFNVLLNTGSTQRHRLWAARIDRWLSRTLPPLRKRGSARTQGGSAWRLPLRLLRTQAELVAHLARCPGRADTQILIAPTGAQVAVLLDLARRILQHRDSAAARCICQALGQLARVPVEDDDKTGIGIGSGSRARLQAVVDSGLVGELVQLYDELCRDQALPAALPTPELRLRRSVLSLARAYRDAGATETAATAATALSSSDDGSSESDESDGARLDCKDDKENDDAQQQAPPRRNGRAARRLALHRDMIDGPFASIALSTTREHTTHLFVRWPLAARVGKRSAGRRWLSAADVVCEGLARGGLQHAALGATSLVVLSNLVTSSVTPAEMRQLLSHATDPLGRALVACLVSPAAPSWRQQRRRFALWVLENALGAHATRPQVATLVRRGALAVVAQLLDDAAAAAPSAPLTPLLIEVALRTATTLLIAGHDVLEPPADSAEDTREVGALLPTHSSAVHCYREPMEALEFGPRLTRLAAQLACYEAMNRSRACVDKQSGLTSPRPTPGPVLTALTHDPTFWRVLARRLALRFFGIPEEPAWPVPPPRGRRRARDWPRLSADCLVALAT